MWATRMSGTELLGVSASQAWSHGRELRAHFTGRWLQGGRPRRRLVLRRHSLEDEQGDSGTVQRSLSGLGPGDATGKRPLSHTKDSGWRLWAR